MTENDWLTSTDPKAMYAFLTETHFGPAGLARQEEEKRQRRRLTPGDRPFRMFAAACAHLHGDAAKWDEWAERDSIEGEYSTAGAAMLWVGQKVGQAHQIVLSREIAAATAHLLREVVGNPFRPVKPLVSMCPNKPKTRLIALPAECAPEWVWNANLDLIVSLAQAAYDERTRECKECVGTGAYFGPPTEMRDGIVRLYGGRCKVCPPKDEEYGTGRIEGGTLDPQRLAVLSDAMEEAGCPTVDAKALLRELDGCFCDDYGQLECARCGEIRNLLENDLLGHLRSPGPHVRGCHVLDLIRGVTQP